MGCKFCVLASILCGRGYMCRPCWRRQYHNKPRKRWLIHPVG